MIAAQTNVSQTFHLSERVREEMERHSRATDLSFI
jgi:hypothetical protein